MDLFIGDTRHSKNWAVKIECLVPSKVLKALVLIFICKSVSK